MASSLSSGRRNSLAGTGNKTLADTKAGSEFFDCLRFCAMFDKPYIARYERKAGGLLQLVGTFKDVETAGPGIGKRSTVIIPFDQIRTQAREERCCWCGKKGGLVHCLHGCGQLICAASTTTASVEQGSSFRCRRSCGATGLIRGFIETCEASKGLAPSRKPSPAALLAGKGSAAALPSGQLRLKS